MFMRLFALVPRISTGILKYWPKLSLRSQVYSTPVVAFLGMNLLRMVTTSGTLLRINYNHTTSKFERKVG